MDLIDRKLLMKKIANHDIRDSMKTVNFERLTAFEWTKYDLYKYVTDSPAIDAMPIVRCKDCKHRQTLECPMFYETFVDDNETYGCWDDNDNTEDDGFCYRGEKIDDAE